MPAWPKRLIRFFHVQYSICQCFHNITNGLMFLICSRWTHNRRDLWFWLLAWFCLCWSSNQI
jgi:hypothetical protein